MSSTRPDPDTFLVRRRRRRDRSRGARTKRRLGEVAYEALDTLSGTRRRAARLARSATPQREVLVIGVYRPGSLLAEALPALLSERHRVRIALGSTGPADEPLREHTVAENLDGGKFENLNRLLEAAGPDDPDWTIAIDDDVRVPRAFLDRFVGVCEAFELDLAQPAQTLRSHSAWKVTRRRPATLVRETRFVEIGPVTAFGRAAAAELLPFPELRYGWGLDLMRHRRKTIQKRRPALGADSSQTNAAETARRIVYRMISITKRRAGQPGFGIGHHRHDGRGIRARCGLRGRPGLRERQLRERELQPGLRGLGPRPRLCRVHGHHGWTVTDGNVDWTGSGSGMPPRATRASTSTALRTPTGAISQTFDTNLGSTYVVTFNMSGNPDKRQGDQDDDRRRHRRHDAVVHLRHDGQDDPSAAMNWVPKTYTFVATSASTTLTFASTTGSG